MIGNEPGHRLLQLNLTKFLTFDKDRTSQTNEFKPVVVVLP